MSAYDVSPEPSIERRWRRLIYAFAAETVVGSCGRMIMPTKHRYRELYPDHVLAFNGNICIRSAGKVWYGDLDLTRHGERLQILANVLHEPVYVLHEKDARFDREDDPDYTRPAALYEPRNV